MMRSCPGQRISTADRDHSGRCSQPLRNKDDQDEIAGQSGAPTFRDVGDVVASGIAVGNGVVYFTAVGSGKLIALDAASGDVLKEIELGPVFAGPSLSRGRVYVGGGNTLFGERDGFFPKKYTGSVRCFGLPDEVEPLGQGDAEPPIDKS